MGRSPFITFGLTLTAMLGAVSTAQAQEQWRYGTHPVLGLSAHISLDDGSAVGLACNQAEFNPISDSFVALRVTDDLVFDGNFVMLFDGAGDIVTKRGDWSRSGDGYTQWAGNTCETSIDAFRRANALVSTPARITSFSGWGEDAYVDFELETLSGRAFQQDGYADLPKRRAISLSGSSAAIGQLIAACPSMRIDIEQNCGI